MVGVWGSVGFRVSNSDLGARQGINCPAFRIEG